MKNEGIILLEKNDFILKKAKLYQLQAYIEMGMTLPTAEEFESSYNMGINADHVTSLMFKALGEQYEAIHAECNHFNEEVFKEGIVVATDIISYGLKIGRSYGELLPIIEAELAGKISKELAKEQIQEITKDLKALAQVHSEAAAVVSDSMAVFLKHTAAIVKSLELLKGECKRLAQEEVYQKEIKREMNLARQRNSIIIESARKAVEVVIIIKCIIETLKNDIEDIILGIEENIEQAEGADKALGAQKAMGEWREVIEFAEAYKQKADIIIELQRDRMLDLNYDAEAVNCM